MRTCRIPADMADDLTSEASVVTSYVMADGRERRELLFADGDFAILTMLKRRDLVNRWEFMGR